MAVGCRKRAPDPSRPSDPINGVRRVDPPIQRDLKTKNVRLPGKLIAHQHAVGSVEVPAVTGLVGHLHVDVDRLCANRGIAFSIKISGDLNVILRRWFLAPPESRGRKTKRLPQPTLRRGAPGLPWEWSSAADTDGMGRR